MTELTYLFATLAVLTGVMTSISIWALRQLRLKLGALGAAVCSCRRPTPASCTCSRCPSRSR